MLVFSAFAQTGQYQYANKSTGTTIGLHLRADGVFIYEYEQDWARATTQGKWRPLGSGRVILTSDYQLTDYTLEEIEDSTYEGVQLLLQGGGKGQSPATVQQLYLNEDETARFLPDGETSLQLLEARRRVINGVDAAQRDSIEQTDPPRCYHYPSPKIAESVTLVFGQQEVLIPIKNPKATRLVLTTRFSPQSGYKYMKEQEFIKKGDYISEAGKAIKLKKRKR